MTRINFENLTEHPTAGNSAKSFRRHMEMFYEAILEQPGTDEEKQKHAKRVTAMRKVQDMLDVMDLFTLGQMYGDVEAQKRHLVTPGDRDKEIPVEQMQFQVVAATDPDLNPGRKSINEGVKLFSTIVHYIQRFSE